MKRFVWLITIGSMLIFAAAGLIVGWRLSGAANGELVSPVVEEVNRIVENLPGRLPSPAPTLPPIPPAKILVGGTQVFQTFNNCGPASLSMALSYYGRLVTQQQLGQQLRPYQQSQGDNDDKSVTFAELAAKAAADGFIVYHRPAGEIELLQQLVAQDLPVITRTLLTTDQDIGHYRVVKGYDQAQGVLIQDDSLQGANLRYSYDDFLALWKTFNYEFLVLVPPEKQAVVEQLLGERVDEAAAWQLALQLTEEALAQNPNDLYARLNQVVALYHLEKHQEATAVFEQIETRLPFRTLWYQIEPILAYYQLGQDERVLALTEEILNNQNRAFSELYWLRGEIFTKRGQPTAAAEEFAKAQQYNSTAYWRENL